jgi:L-alanine-DL-glutamate epimerase-like enolase superfamily enzyme
VNRRALIKSIAAVPLASAFAWASPLGKVKITGFEIHKVSVRWRDLMFVEVHTDAGIAGLGGNFAEFERKCPYKAIRSRAQVKL